MSLISLLTTKPSLYFLHENKIKDILWVLKYTFFSKYLYILQCVTVTQSWKLMSVFFMGFCSSFVMYVFVFFFLISIFFESMLLWYNFFFLDYFNIPLFTIYYISKWSQKSKNLLCWFFSILWCLLYCLWTSCFRLYIISLETLVRTLMLLMLM